MNMKRLFVWLCPRLGKWYTVCLIVMYISALLAINALATDDMWTVANTIIVSVYTKIAGISTVLAGLMSAIAVIGAKLSNNQHKVDQAWILSRGLPWG